MVVCPTEPDPDNGAEGCGETFTAVPDEDYVECPSCGLAFDVARAQALETM
jgi:rubredoxin